MDRGLLKSFWNCGDGEIIDFALKRARLNKREAEVIELLLDECLTQEEAAWRLNISTRNLQNIWRTAAEKILSIPWVRSYAIDCCKK